MWDVFAASYKQQKRTIKDLIAETFQVTSCLYNVGLERVGKFFFIANDCGLCRCYLGGACYKGRFYSLEIHSEEPI